ncbi:MAG: glycosyltransferase [Oscillospiraceae bacterium]|jgi:glycosyltransferase involved in cell wall biosynthesis|nr:glycosyltransferase [Oscillospiraceae bacterium]
MNQKKPRLLFILPNLQSGGAEKSLVTLLEVLGEKHGAGRDFGVDLFLFEAEGLFLRQLPPWVRILTAGKAFSTFNGSGRRALCTFLLRGQPRRALARLRFAKAWRLPENQRVVKCWKALRPALPRLHTSYDAAIGYLEGYSNYYCADCVKAKRKLIYYHTDCRRMELYHPQDQRCFVHVDAIVSVSESCCGGLRDCYPQFSEKIHCIENMLSPGLLHKLSRKEAPPWIADAHPVVLTIGRLAQEKGIDLAVKACALLKKSGAKLRWFVIGGGNEAPLRALIRQEGLEGTFFLLGECANPYPALTACDSYVQPSRHEGKCIALEEAKALQRAIVCTNFGTVADQISHENTGLIAEIDPESIAKALLRLLNDPALCASLRQNLKNYGGNEGEAEKFLSLCGILS